MSTFSRKKVYGREACFEAFSKTLKKKTVVVMDNASVHTSEEFEECLSQWKKQGLIIKYLPPYSPELNLIEILWRNIKPTLSRCGLRKNYIPSIECLIECR
jgi:transposase